MFSVFIAFVDRGNLSIAAPLLKDELHLSASQLGILLSSFFWTNSLCLLPAGSLIDRFDATWILAVGFFLWSAATTVTGFVHGFAALLALRLLLGVAEAVAYPAYANIFANHFPEHHRGIANGFIGAGQGCGLAFATFTGGMLLGRFGWRFFFISLGLISLPWLIPWLVWRPRRKTVASAKTRRPLAEVVEVLKQGSAWGTCVGLFSANYFGYLLLTWLPYYLVHGRHFSLVFTAKVGGTAFVIKAASVIVSGRLSDFWISSDATPTLVRKTFLFVGSALGGTLLLFAGLVSDNACVILLLAASASLGLTTPHHFAASQTLAGKQMAGTWTGLQGFVGNLAGVVAPALTGFTVDLTGQFLWAFIITAVVGWIGAASWLFLVGPVRQVVWTHLKPAE